MKGTSSPHLRRISIRVALSATAVVAIIYLVISVAIVTWLSLNLTAQVDDRLARSLSFEVAAAEGLVPNTTTPTRQPPATTGGPPAPNFPFGRERVTWHVAADGTVTSDRTDLTLPEAYFDVTGPVTITVDGTDLRVAGAAVPDGHVVVGESMGAVNDARATATLGLLVIAPFLLGAVFVGSVAIGRRVAMPIERTRQRQLAFTADASHELRTPLAVIEANASLALQEERQNDWYRDAFGRVLDEAKRMHRLIDDLLWLARFDSASAPADEGPVDLGVLVEGAADRFSSVAESRSITLTVHIEVEELTVTAPAEWIDQLIGVLLDNACKYAPEGGNVAVTVEAREGRAWVVVDDDGPGTTAEQRERVFDRFHRGSNAVGGAGLGLAIGDAIVEATGGRWHLGTAPMGGARFAVGWPIPASEKPPGD